MKTAYGLLAASWGAMVLVLAASLVWAGPTDAASGDQPSSPILFKSTRDLTPVRLDTRRGAPVVATLGAGAVVALMPTQETRGCEQGWFARQSGGFICGKHLVSTKAEASAVAPFDDPRSVASLMPFVVPRYGPRVYESMAYVEAGTAMLRLRKGSVVRATGPAFRRHGQTLLRNRKGFLIDADTLVALPAPERSLGLRVDASQPRPFGIVVGSDVRVRAEPDLQAAEVASLPRWTWISGEVEAGATAKQSAPSGWQRLPAGGFVEDAQLATWHEPAAPADLAATERWIAVDLKEQLAAAYEGRRLVRLMPCSTGEKGNTPSGTYRVQLKKRLHTMRLLMGQVRVEDVPWVMFFDRDEALAIHSAYWHSDFGTPRSHGCVNLPEEDARWVYEWTAPHPSIEDSETMAVPESRGSRVVIF